MSKRKLDDLIEVRCFKKSACTFEREKFSHECLWLINAGLFSKHFLYSQIIPRYKNEYQTEIISDFLKNVETRSLLENIQYVFRIENLKIAQ